MRGDEFAIIVVVILMIAAAIYIFKYLEWLVYT
jgi:hypothetical protein